MNIKIIKADYLNKTHAQDIPFLLDYYARDPMGGGSSLSTEVKENLVKELSKRPYAFSIISYVNNNVAGLINCFEQFSTFSCKPVINIHDIIVLKEYRGNHLCHKMLEKVEEIAISKGACKLTLEILENNLPAKSSYSKFGFSDYELDPKMGKALFWQKIIKNNHTK